MKALSPMQARLVDAKCRGLGVGAAGKEAGYSDHAAASRALALPHVHAEIMKRATAVLFNGSINAANKVNDLLEADSEKIQLEAAKALLDRVGLSKPDDSPVQSVINVQFNIE